MISMRPPQHGQAGSLQLAALSAGSLRGFGAASSSRARAMFVGAARFGEQAVVTDAVEALGQHVDAEAADELVGCERRSLVSVAALDPVILPFEDDTSLIEGD
jgi:hypothetical protein